MPNYCRAFRVAIAAQISLSVKDRPMREVIKELEETTEYRFSIMMGSRSEFSDLC